MSQVIKYYKRKLPIFCNLLLQFKHCNTIFLLSILILCFFHFSAAAQTRTLTIEEALKLAYENNYEVKAMSLDIKSKEALKATARQLPQLQLGTEIGQYNSPATEYAFNVSQTIPFPTLFHAKKEVINSEIEIQKQTQSIYVNDLRKAIRLYYYQLAYFNHNDEKLSYLDSIYAEFIRIGNIRYNAGEIKKIEINTAQVDQGKIRLLKKQNERWIRATQENLRTLLNITDSILLPPHLNYEPLAYTGITDSLDLHHHPKVQLLLQEISRIEKSKKVELAEQLPEFTLGYSNQSLMGMHPVNGIETYFDKKDRFHVFNLGISIPLPTGSQRAKQRSLTLQKQAMENRVMMEEQNLELALKNAVNQYKTELEVYQYYVEQALPNSEQIVQAAKVGYRTGEISYLEYMHALEAITDTELKYLESIQDLNKTVIEIYALINQ